MRRLAVIGLVAALLLPIGVSAQQEERNEAMYQGLWCLYLHSRAYLVDVPADVTCEYEPRAMTKEEASEFYLAAVDASNNAGNKWDCAVSQNGGSLSWSQSRKWSARYLEASKRFDSTLRKVRWPQTVGKKIDPVDRP